MTTISLFRNGYHRRADGCFVKLLRFGSPSRKGNHNVEMIVRDGSGKIISVKKQKNS